MRTIKHKILALLIVTIVLCSLVVAFAYAEEAPETSYYVCFSSQNFAVRNANKMTFTDGEYVLTDVSIGATEEFYVTDNKGTKFYAVNGDELTTGETGTYSYTIKFSPDKIYSEEQDGFKRTDCHVTFGFYVPTSVSISIGGVDTPMTYNPYFTAYDLFYISRVWIEAGTEVTYGDEVHTVADSGSYRILFTTGETVGDDTRLFDADGAYGTGDDYIYHIYIEDAPEFYLTFVDSLKGVGDPDIVINGEDAFLLSRDETSVGVSRYTGSGFFANENGFVLKYRIYEKSPTGSFTLIDDDSDKDTSFSKITVQRVGNYNISFIDGGDRFVVATERVEYDHNGWYILGSFNGWGFTEDGEVDLKDEYKLTEIEIGDADYTEDYDQYRINFYVSRDFLKDNDYEFIITDGEQVFMNLANYITVTEPGEYELIFSDEHDYGRGRNYRYSLVDEEADMRELVIRTPEEYNDFAAKCNESADYSKGLTVYLAADIDFAGATITPITLFNGILRGGYHKITGFVFADDAHAYSLFALVTKNAVIERLYCDINVNKRDADYVGFVGKNYGTVKYVTVTGAIEGADYVGAVVAYNGRGAETTGATESAYVNGIVAGCVSEANVIGFSSVGCVVGFNNGELRDCESKGTVQGKTYVASRTPINIGGLCGYSAGRIVECKNYAVVRSEFSMLNVGGIAGQMTGDVYYSFNYAEISGSKYVGGIVGYYGTITEDEEDLSDFFGGMTYEEFLESLNDDDGEYEQIDGRTHAIYYSANEGRVSAKSYVGGIIGYTNEAAPVEMCVNTSSISATGGGYAGGIAGFAANAQIRSCMAAGNISANGTVGAEYVGGIVGYGGSVVGSMSTCDITGDDYVGGISGYQSGTLQGCYSVSLVVAPSSAQNVGAVAGYSESFNESVGNFGGVVSDNYYIGDIGGIGRQEFGAGYDNAAVHITPQQLGCEGTLPTVLSSGFAREDWVASDSATGYPQPKYFFEAKDCEYYDNETEFNRIFENYKDIFTKYTKDYMKVSFIVSFLEWNSGNGELYDENGNINDSVYEIVHTERVYFGDSSRLVAPAFKYAIDKNGAWVMETDKANYFVSFTLPTGLVTDNVSVYADYKEVITTLKTTDGKALIEGSFVKGTVAELISTSRGYVVRLTLDGAEVSYDSYKVKYLTDNSSSDYKVVFASPDGSYTDAETVVSGSYIAFTLNSQDAFSLAYVKGDGLSTVAIIVLSAVSGIVVCAIVFGIIIAVSHKRTKKETSDNTEQEENKE